VSAPSFGIALIVAGVAGIILGFVGAHTGDAMHLCQSLASRPRQANRTRFKRGPNLINAVLVQQNTRDDGF